MSRLVQLQRIFREAFDDDALTITPETSQRDLAGWDSVAHIKIVLALESELGVRLAADEVIGIKSVGEFLAAIDRHVSA